MPDAPLSAQRGAERPCLAELEADVVELQQIMHTRFAVLNEQVAALKREVSELRTELAANARRDAERESFIATFGRICESVAHEAARVTDDSQRPS